MGYGESAYVPFDTKVEEVADAIVKAAPKTFADFADVCAKLWPTTREKDFEDQVQAFGDYHAQASWREFHAALVKKVDNVLNDKSAGRKLGEQDAIEKVDPKHRAAWLLKKAIEVYNEKKPAEGLFEWLDSLPEFERIVVMRGGSANNDILKPSELPQFLKGVKYLDDAARPSYAVSIERGRLLKGDVPYDTRDETTVHSGVGWAVFVQSPKTKTFYTGSHAKGQFHHSSFLAGEPVMSAGEWKVTDGQLKLITSKSGHYKPDIEDMIAALESLRAVQVDLSAAQIGVCKGGAAQWVPVNTFLNDPKRAEYSAWKVN